MNTLISYWFCAMLLLPIMAAFLCRLMATASISAARYSGYLLGISFLISLGLVMALSISEVSVSYEYITLSSLNALLGSMVLLVSFVVHRFSLRYLNGDRLYSRYYILLSGLTFSLLLMVFADHLFLYWGAALLSNIFLVMLMTHKKEWNAAKNSGVLAMTTLLIGSVCLLLAFISLSMNASTRSITQITEQASLISTPVLLFSVTLMLVAGTIQSALWPFHRWLMSSLNSPTPVSAFMHAGLVNGGGILIVKFAPLFLLQPGLLNALFILGAISGLLATVWKLIQPDIKKMLACSTIAQMGFMMMQCGLGLFAAAIAHLCWHGLFKAYLFLSSGSALLQNKSESKASETSLLLFMVSLIGGLVAMYSFAFATNKILSITDPSAFVLYFAFIAGSDLMLTWIRSYRSFSSVLSGILLSAFFGLMYGASIQLIMWLLPSSFSTSIILLGTHHWLIMMIFGLLWLLNKFPTSEKLWRSKFGAWLYMNLLNSSQPSAKTITAIRSHYHY